MNFFVLSPEMTVRIKYALVKHLWSACVCVSGVNSDSCTECVFVPQSYATGTE